MNNECVFSPGVGLARTHRYVLRCSWEPLLPPKFCMFIGLNPSTADETQLDNTLRRIKGYCMAWGYNGFIMTNAFAFRDKDPDVMKMAADPIGPENDKWILQCADECDLIIACWGVHATFMDREKALIELLKGRRLCALHVTADGHPGHPLYLPAEALPFPYPPPPGWVPPVYGTKAKKKASPKNPRTRSAAAKA